MNPAVPFLFFVSLVTASHAAFLSFARARLRYDLALRQRWWNQHLLLNGILWLVVFAWVLLLQRLLPHEATTLAKSIIGWVLIGLGAVLVSWSRLLLGRHQAMGIRFFLPERARQVSSSLYRYLNNPMYDGFILLLVGMGLAFGLRENFFIAVASFILLNLLLARLENPRSSLNPF